MARKKRIYTPIRVVLPAMTVGTNQEPFPNWLPRRTAKINPTTATMRDLTIADGIEDESHSWNECQRDALPTIRRVAAALTKNIFDRLRRAREEAVVLPKLRTK